MKKITLLIFILGVILTTIQITPGYAQEWVSQESGTGKQLFGVHFINPDTGWVVGDYGTILRTFDGGAHWDSMGSGTIHSLRDVKFVNSRLGWAVGTSGTILFTTDGGDSWNPADNSGATLWRCSFSDSINGWAVGMNRGIVHTTDGGQTWTAQTNFSGEVPEHTELKGVFFYDSLTGWACGKDGIILRTTNGGELWVRQNVPPTSEGYNMNYNGIIFPENPLEGWVGGKWGEILHTTDGGGTWKSWRRQVAGVIEVPECLMGGVFFVDNQNGWGVGKYGRIVSTCDGGTHTYYDTLGRPTYGDYPGQGWVIEVDRGDPQCDLRGLHAVRRSDQIWVWAVGEGGTILHKKVGGTDVDEEPIASELPKAFNLAQNYPNPFNPKTKISYQIHQTGHVTLRIYNILGQEVKRLVDAHQEANSYTVRWDGKNEESNQVSSGIYFYKIEAGNFTATKKMVMLR